MSGSMADALKSIYIFSCLLLLIHNTTSAQSTSQIYSASNATMRDSLGRSSTSLVPLAVNSLPPIALSLEPIQWDNGNYLIVTNRTMRRLNCRLIVKADQFTNSHHFILHGYMKIRMTRSGAEKDWIFSEGDRGWIEIEGFSKVLYFEIDENDLICGEFPKK